MAGFGAGFGKSLAGSLESAGKLHQEEQMRSREYERAKADRLAEIADARDYQDRVRLDERAHADAKEARAQELKDEENPDRVVSRGGKYYFIKRDGSEKELMSGDPLVTGHLRAKKTEGQKDTLYGLSVAKAHADINQSNAAAAASNASARSNSGKLPDDVYARVQHDLSPVSAKYKYIDDQLQKIDNRLVSNGNKALSEETRALRRALFDSQQVLAAEYTASGYAADPSKLFETRAEELRTKFPKAWGVLHDATNRQNQINEEKRRAAEAARRKQQG